MRYDGDRRGTRTLQDEEVMLVRFREGNKLDNGRMIDAVHDLNLCGHGVDDVRTRSWSFIQGVPFNIFAR